MKKFVIKAITFVLLTITALFFIVTEVIPPQYNTTYQSVINDKFIRLLGTHSPKIIFLGGSSGAFGINEDIISKKTGMSVVNLALHASMGLEFECEVSKANIQKNDIVILGNEYTQWMKSPYFGADLIVTGIDNNIKLYQYIPKKHIVDVIEYFPQFALNKTELFLFKPVSESNSVYQRNSFKNGSMIYNRPECILPKTLSEETYGVVYLNKNTINQAAIQYINDFSKYVNNKGAKLLITFPPLLNEALRSNKSDTNQFEKCLSEKLNAPIISNINDYVFTREYMYDTIYHCNNRGEKRRSELLADDINKYLYH